VASGKVALRGEDSENRKDCGKRGNRNGRGRMLASGNRVPKKWVGVQGVLCVSGPVELMTSPENEEKNVRGGRNRRRAGKVTERS